MIYQCYFAPEQKSRLFDSPLYRGFGLEPVVNPDITKNCPELADPEIRLFLTEYAAFLHLWRNPPDDGDDWSGFTSYRQLDKFPTILTDKAQIEADLKTHDILGWGFYELIQDSPQKRVSIADHGESCHPGITAYLELVLSKFDREIPKRYFASTQGLFANYWLMSKKLFNDYMEWSWPMVKWGLNHRSQYTFIQSHPKSIGQAMERFFNIWYIQNQFKLKNVGETFPWYVMRIIPPKRSGQPAWRQSAADSPLARISFVIAVHRGDKYRRTRACLERLGVTDIVAIRDASSLSAAYDEGERRARNEIICFLHQDAEIQSLDARLVFEKFKDPTTGFLGVAGTRLLDQTGVWWQGLNTPQQVARLSGRCGHQTEDRRWITEYGPFGKVVVLDGLLLITTKTVLCTIGGFADPPLNGFDFYDISVTLRAWLRGYHNYTIPIDLYHWGTGAPRPAWEQYRRIFLEKYGSYLPASVGIKPTSFTTGQNQPLVSVITPCYTYESSGQFMRRALECVRASTYRNIEHIVIDDGSPDEIPEILESLQKEYPFTLIKLPANTGLASATNLGISHSTGKYILPLHADNYFSNDYIERLVDVAEALGDDYSPFYTHTQFFGEVEGQTPRPRWSLKRLLVGPFIDEGSLFSKRAIESVGGFDAQAVPLGDYELFLCMALCGFKGQLIEGPLLFFSVRRGALSDHFDQHGGSQKKIRAIRYIFNKHRARLSNMGYDVDDIIEHVIQYVLPQHTVSFATSRARSTLAPDNSQRILQTALALHQRGGLGGAIAQYEALLTTEPENTVALANLASILRQVRRPEEALVRYRRVLALDDSLPEVWFNFANLLHQQDHFAEAEDAYRQAIARNPNLYPAHFNLGNLLRDLGRADEAEACYQETLRLRPGLARAHTNLGNLLRGQGRVEEAIVHHRQATQLTPDDPDVHHNLGNALREAGEEEAAEKAYRQALVVAPRSVAAILGLARFLQAADRADEAESLLRRAVDDQPEEPRPLRLLAENCYKQGRFAEAQELYQRALAVEPDHADTHNALGVVLQALGQTDEAVACWEHAITLRPDHASAHSNLGAMYRMLNRHKEAIDHLRTAVRLAPDMPEAQVHLSYALLEVGQISEGVAIAESVVAQQPDSAGGYLMLGFGLAQQARIAESLAALQESQRLSPEANVALSNTLFAALYSDQHDAAAITDLHRELAGRIVPSGPVFERWDNPPHPDRPLRVGYLSPDLRGHPVGYFLEPILAHHRADQVDVVCYADVAVSDETTDRLRELTRSASSEQAPTWHNCHGWPDDRLAEQIRTDGVDILVDLVGHTSGNRATLLARKPAPIQMLYLGYPCTSGLPVIDYVIADRWVVPKNLAHLYTEEVLALRGCFLCYQPQPDVPEVAPLPALTNGYVTFGSYNNSPKLSATTIRLWAEVLHAVPRSRLALKALAFRDAGTRALFVDRFEAQGIAQERVDLLPPTTPLPNFMAEYRRIDIALDPLPYNGGTTTCDALWMGVPVVTLPGEHFFSRMGLSVLRAVGLPELVAETPADYVRIAAELAGDVDRLIDLRATMRARLTASSLCDGPGFTQRLEAAYRDAWRKWCYICLPGQRMRNG